VFDWVQILRENSGNIQGVPRLRSRTIEVLSDRPTTFAVEHPWTTYRSFRMKSMYEQ
jgi:hypothetical protein